MLTEQQIESNYNELLSIIEKYEGKRWERLLLFHNEYLDRIALMPASTKKSYHSCFPGGYVQHVLNVYHTAFKLKDLWESLGATLDFTDEELAFVSLFHDLGKFGTKSVEGFEPTSDQWQQKNGIMYKMGDGLQFMKDSDRSIFLLQELGCKMSEKEYLAIKLHAGLFEESNKSYFMAYSPEYNLQSNLVFILHHADWTSARIESQQGVANVSKTGSKPKITQTKTVEKIVLKAPAKSSIPEDDETELPKVEKKEVAVESKVSNRFTKFFQ